MECTYNIGKESMDIFDWGCYMEGYKEGTTALLKSLEQPVNRTNKFRLLPTVFLCRHFVELSLKEILIHEKFINNEDKFETNHNLKSLWTNVQHFLKNENYSETFKGCHYPYNEYNKLFLICNELIEFLIIFDNGSYNFRYPVKKDFSNSLPRSLIIDVKDFRRKFEFTSHFFSIIITNYMRHEKYYNASQ